MLGSAGVRKRFCEGSPTSEAGQPRRVPMIILFEMRCRYLSHHLTTAFVSASARYYHEEEEANATTATTYLSQRQPAVRSFRGKYTNNWRRCHHDGHPKVHSFAWSKQRGSLLELCKRPDARS